MRTVFVRVNGRGICYDLTDELIKELVPIDALIERIKRAYKTDDVIFEGFGDF